MVGKLFINNIFSEARDYIFPIFCLGCEKEGVWVCDQCLTTIEVKGVWCCPVCQANSTAGQPCAGCSKQSWLDWHIAIAKYTEEGLIGKIIQTFKYQFAEELVNVISSLVANFFISSKENFNSIDLVVPVPLHRKREAERGFNQAELIGQIVADKLGVQMQSILLRSKETKQQAKLSRVERINNVAEAFRLGEKVVVSGKNILLVDDVFTTGSTMQECARILKQAGAVRVGCFTVARG